MRDRSKIAVDPLSDVLNFLQARCNMSGRLVAGGTWSRRFANLDAVKFCAVTEGACWYFMEGLAAPVSLKAGDVLIMNGTRPLILASDPALMSRAMTTSLAQDSDDQYRLGQGEDFVMLGGMVQIDPDRQALLLSGLPPVIHVRGTAQEAGPIAWLLEQLVTEMKPSIRPGREIVVAGLAQLLFVQTLRVYLTQALESDGGWLKGFGDHRLAMALSSMHHDPTHNWNLDELAKEANMSRTSFAVRFREMMGIPPLTYLAQWRMHLAKRELQAGASIAKAAAIVGYSSESAFSSAFKRAMGVTPGQYRKNHAGRMLAAL